jgi:hypothetical protein
MQTVVLIQFEGKSTDLNQSYANHVAALLRRSLHGKAADADIRVVVDATSRGGKWRDGRQAAEVVLMNCPTRMVDSRPTQALKRLAEAFSFAIEVGLPMSTEEG